MIYSIKTSLNHHLSEQRQTRLARIVHSAEDMVMYCRANGVLAVAQIQQSTHLRTKGSLRFRAAAAAALLPGRL